MKNEELIRQAFEARKQSYCPYSGYAVGAALLGKDGKLFHGCNIESVSYSPTNCAERTAIFKAISEGTREFEAIAVVGGKKELGPGEVGSFPPCGVCRQVMSEFCGLDFKVLVAKSESDYREYTLADLLPHGFAGSNTKED